LSPTARLFRGHFQRGLRYIRGNYEYEAGEMSIPSPAGLSGGPLFRPHDFNYVTAVATENVQSTTYVGRIEEVTKEGVVERHVERDVAQYGIAAVLAPLSEWLDEVAPRAARRP
jgi:hypothetical protein